MPFVRLIAIYVVVILAVLGVFKREAVVAMLSGSQEEETLPPIPAMPETSGQQDEAEPAPAAAPQAPETAPVRSSQHAAEPAVEPAARTVKLVPPTPPTETGSAADNGSSEQQAQGAPGPVAPSAAVAGDARVGTAAARAEQRQSADMVSRWNEARQAYWRGDLARAEGLYVALLEDFPDQADLAGELGNIYFTQGKLDMAAEFFERAGVGLLRSGNKARAMSVVGVLRGIAPDRATALAARISDGG